MLQINSLVGLPEQPFDFLFPFLVDFLLPSLYMQSQILPTLFKVPNISASGLPVLAGLPVWQNFPDCLLPS